MASILTEIYVSIDNLEFAKLDLYKDEKFVMKFKKTDSDDIAKIFTPFSQSFTFPATPKNKKALGYFGNTEVIKINTDNKLFCKIYTNGMLNQTGLLTLENVKYKNGKAENFAGGFSTNMVSLKDRIGNDTLNDLGHESIIDWYPSSVHGRLRVVPANSVLKSYVPLISLNRVLNYDAATDSNDNVFYKSTNAPTTNRVIKTGELRPCVSVVSLLDIIKDKYNLTIVTPLESQPELNKLNIWCNNESFTNLKNEKFIIKKPFVLQPYGQNAPPQNAVANLTDSSVKLTIPSSILNVTMFLRYLDTAVLNTSEKTMIHITIVSKATGRAVVEYSSEIINGQNDVGVIIPLGLFVGGVFEFYIQTRFDDPVFFTRSTLYNKFHVPSGFTFFSSNDNYNYYDNNNYKIDLIKALPNMKVIDFITSYFKMFNLSIYDSSPNTDSLFFLTPLDTDTSIHNYSKKEVDYTQFTDVKKVTKTTLSKYNYYNFSHALSKYRSNIDFKNQFGTEYGQTFYPSVKPSNPNEFKIETKFSIIPPVKLNGTANILTAYGFTSDTPEADINGAFRYSPNYNEPTLFYNNGSTLFTERLGCQNLNPAGNLVNTALERYVKTTPFCIENNNSLGFSILVNDDINYPLNLFSLYYAKQISRLLNPNALKHVFKMKLPSDEIYLNDNTTLIPSGFRLQNEIIIGETKYETLEADIDQTTGDSTLTLLNI